MLAESIINLKSSDLKIIDLSDIAKIFAEYTKNGDLLLLSGKVGAGKSEFSRQIIKAKAINDISEMEEVSSPTFSLIQRYEFQSCKISQIDLYRVESEGELFELGIPDIFDSQITLLEWPEIIQTQNLSRYVSIKIQETENFKETMNIKLVFFGPRWDHLINALIASKYFQNENIYR